LEAPVREDSRRERLPVKSKFAFSIAAAVALSALGAASASADVVYSYTGNDFQFVTSPYTTNDSLTGSVTLSTALGDNLSLASATPTSYTFSDGVSTITNTNQTNTPLFSFSTDSAGNITDWQIIVQDSNNVIETVLTGGPEDFGETLVGLGINHGPPGTWTTPVSQTPLPAALPLFAAGLGALGLLGWRRKRKNAAAVVAT
jgi:hypothetical protein